MDRQKGIAPILIIILIATAVGGYLLYQNQAKPAVSQPDVQPSSSPVTSPTATSSADMANWKTYTNQQNKFSIQYPQAVIITKDTTNEITLRFPDDSNSNLIFDQVFISIKNISGITDIKQAINSYDATKLISKDIIIGGISGLYFDSVPAAYEASDAFMIRGSQLFSFRVEGNSAKFLEDKKVFYQILSTFKFTQ